MYKSKQKNNNNNNKEIYDHSKIYDYKFSKFAIIENLRFHILKCLVTCFILTTKDNFGKFDYKVDEGICLRYFTSTKAYRVFKKEP